MFSCVTGSSDLPFGSSILSIIFQTRQRAAWSNVSWPPLHHPQQQTTERSTVPISGGIHLQTEHHLRGNRWVSFLDGIARGHRHDSPTTR